MRAEPFDELRTAPFRRAQDGALPTSSGQRLSKPNPRPFDQLRTAPFNKLRAQTN
jgi:hypothetical protein